MEATDDCLSLVIAQTEAREIKARVVTEFAEQSGVCDHQIVSLRCMVKQKRLNVHC